MTFQRTVVAFKTATASENRIHTDNVASRFALTGDLAPGGDVFACMTAAPVALCGVDWLSRGPRPRGSIVPSQTATPPPLPPSRPTRASCR